MSCLLQIREEEAERKEAQPCIRCARCTDACPMGLEPYLLAQLSRCGRLEDMEQHQVMACIECGSCHFICPSRRPLLDYIRLGKNQTGKMIRNRMQK
jgi:electron transport complex protein RnfC